jgi:hypothetical protein
VQRGRDGIGLHGDYGAGVDRLGVRFGPPLIPDSIAGRPLN